MLLAFYAADGRASSPDFRAPQRHWLLEAIKTIWVTFQTRFCELWTASATREGSSAGCIMDRHVYGTAAVSGNGESAAEAVRDRVITQIFADSLGFAGCKMIRRVVGIAHVADLESIEENSIRAVCEQRVLKMGRTLVVDRNALTSIDHVIALAEATRNDGKQPFYPL